MDAVEALKILEEMCEHGCKNCQLYKQELCASKGDTIKGYEKTVVEVLEQWRKDHPIKTYADELKGLEEEESE